MGIGEITQPGKPVTNRKSTLVATRFQLGVPNHLGGAELGRTMAYQGVYHPKQNTIAQYIAARPIYGICVEMERIQG